MVRCMGASRLAQDVKSLVAAGKRTNTKAIFISAQPSFPKHVWTSAREHSCLYLRTAQLSTEPSHEQLPSRAKGAHDQSY